MLRAMCQKVEKVPKGDIFFPEMGLLALAFQSLIFQVTSKSAGEGLNNRES